MQALIKTILFNFFGLVFLTPIAVYSQMPPPPVPNVEVEIRDSTSIRMRSLELERFKREGNKPHPTETSKEVEARFAQIKDDFENIQKLRNEIVKTYTIGTRNGYEKIGSLAAEIKKKSRRLDKNLFSSFLEEESKRDKNEKKVSGKSVRDLIIDLDYAIRSFIASPIFNNLNLVDQNILEKSLRCLEEVLRVSEALSKEAKKLK
jgi:hypothetical protein